MNVCLFSLLTISTTSLISCAHQIDLAPANYDVIDGWSSGFIDSVGFGMYGSPAANAALRNGQKEVKSKICPRRNVEFFAVSPSKMTVHSLNSMDLGYGSSITTGSSSEITIARGYNFVCEDGDIKTKTLIFDDQKMVCKEIQKFAPGELRIERLKINPDTKHCKIYPGWYRVFNSNQNPHDLFFGDEGKKSCEKLLGELAQDNSVNVNRFLLKKISNCEQKPST